MASTSWLGRYPIMLPEDFRRVFSQWKNEQPGPKRIHLRNTIVQGNMRLIAQIAYRYVRRQGALEVEELIAAGCIGLTSALEQYDPEQGASLAVYGSHWIKQAIRKGIHDSNLGKPYQIPEARLQMSRNLMRLSDVFLTEHGRRPNAEELIERARATGKKTLANCTQKTLNILQDSESKATIALDAALRHSDDESVSLYDRLSGDDPNPLQLMSKRQDLVAMQQALSFLNKNQAYVLRLRYGLGGELEHTQQEIADKLGLSRERIRQIEVQALRLLRRNLHLARSFQET